MNSTERIREDLFAALRVDELETMDRLRARLVAAAGDAGILDIAYRTLDTAVGTLLLAATEQGLVRVAYDREDHDAVLAALAEKVSPRILRAPASPGSGRSPDRGVLRGHPPDL